MPGNDSGRWALASRQLMQEVERKLALAGQCLADLPPTTLTIEKRMVP